MSRRTCTHADLPQVLCALRCYMSIESSEPLLLLAGQVTSYRQCTTEPSCLSALLFLEDLGLAGHVASLVEGTALQTLQFQ